MSFKYDHQAFVIFVHHSVIILLHLHYIIFKLKSFDNQTFETAFKYDKGIYNFFWGGESLLCCYQISLIHITSYKNVITFGP